MSGLRRPLPMPGDVPLAIEPGQEVVDDVGDETGDPAQSFLCGF